MSRRLVNRLAKNSLCTPIAISGCEQKSSDMSRLPAMIWVPFRVATRSAVDAEDVTFVIKPVEPATNF